MWWAHVRAHAQVSKEMYRVFMKYTTKIQVVSCDEALLEVTTSAMEPANLAKARLVRSLRTE